MPPRIDLFTTLRRSCSSVTHTALSPISFSLSATASTVAQRRRSQDPVAKAQARVRKQANLTKQEALKTERTKALGDPVKGVSTTFVESFDSRIRDGADAATQHQYDRLNYSVPRSELQQSLEHSKELVKPFRSNFQDIVKFEKQQELGELQHSIAVEALTRITDMENGSSKDQTRINVQRCIEEFGRHNTDEVLRPKPSAQEGSAKKTPRAGPDTGSSEVQIAILTAKIRVLSQSLEGRGRKDLANKRNLRLLVHRRQRLLTYLKRKERGGERWQNLVATLGLTPGTYEGEISL